MTAVSMHAVQWYVGAVDVDRTHSMAADGAAARAILRRLPESRGCQGHSQRVPTHDEVFKVRIFAQSPAYAVRRPFACRYSSRRKAL